ncbi:MAG: hypothetical protein A2750_01630 [Candidatus Yanofskybacteria bacterium RIFCSPHIGHO2_01_FULL_45_42]|uniref:Uncharacterized protein n=2 Tax=Candidatus Yanofskyibacteriota TaxID=1752733 RepID=A0A1F8H3Y2_9BACT|nr:MAG: hypothetical protein A2750_01630 [Candidatus Yanofskybacteria bacterium RIFCSPHIGHO2_01_FULL_45_42]OGN31990.1 MAG: hypothetical protein A3J01_02850 [Candidatus Yanofskybacteria bacterium RIFCSPLOWO2_02_FULL_45_18]
MSGKIKIAIIILALIAAVSAFRFIKTLKGGELSSAILGVSVKKTTPLPTPADDADHDGLKNREESYWNTDFQNPDTDGDGFKDGEEVLTGHDPRIAGPDDWLLGYLPQEKNLTKKTTSLLAAGLFEGSLKPSNPDFDKSISQLMDQMLLQSSANSAPNLAATIGITMVDTSPDNEKTYDEKMKSVSKTLEEEYGNFANLLKLMQGITTKTGEDKFIAAADSAATRTLNLAQEIQNISAPLNHADTHREIIAMLKNMSQSYGLLTNFNDMIQSLTALTTLETLYLTRLIPIIQNLKQ